MQVTCRFTVPRIVILVSGIFYGMIISGQSLESYRSDMKFSFSESSSISNEYFEKYHIEKRESLYYIYAVKTVDVGYDEMVRVMNDFEVLPDFMPGYRSITLKYFSDTTLLAGVVFRPSFSPFTSQFTNSFEIISRNNGYLQCWRQLAPNDAEELIPSKNAPLYNKGYIELWPKKNGKVKLIYLSIVEPPVPVPTWIYRFVVRNTYVEVFEAFIQEAKSDF